MTFRTLLILLAVGCALVAMLVGFGFWDSADVAEDYPGWLAVALMFLAASFIPAAWLDRRIIG